MIRFLTMGILCLSAVPAWGASVVFDSFTEGAHHLSLEGDRQRTAPVTNPFAETRRSVITHRLTSPGTTITSTLETSPGTLDLITNGSRLQSRLLDLHMSYVNEATFSLVGFSAFELDFSTLTGVGNLIIELGSASGIYGPTAHRVAMTGPGTISVPFSELNFGTNGSLESSSVIHFTFEVVSEEFSMVLDEIRVVPEPSAAVMVLPVVFGLLRRRR